ncbi:MAG: molecular chaperone GroEL [Alphaproteobacteria bacterium]|nr:molecular chaperone GroEL [Alphaproteobacteria bacterium]|tara:strand:+ start:595 stop:2175 length:1581 start_codon:yes stop_codon:yes gene_type:complete
MAQFGGPKLVKALHFDNSAKAKLTTGINKIANAVGSTLGPSGRTVVIEDDFGNPHVTKDGVTVANSIMLKNPVENLGVAMMKQAAQQTANIAGDGTTTSIVLAQAIIDCYKRKDGESFSFRDIKSGIEKYKNLIIQELESKAVKIDNSRLDDVSTISANNDPVLGKLIADAFRKAGDNGIVAMETSPSSETYIDTVEGTKLNSTYKSHHFYSNKEKELSELDKPLVFISATDIPNVRKIQDILEFAIKSNRSILLIAPLESQPLTALAMNMVKGNIKVNVIDPPSFGLKRKDILEDLALLVGAKVFDESLGDSIDSIAPDLLGEADKAISDKDGTVLVIKEKSKEAQERIKYLKTALEKENHHVLVKHLNDRLALLCGGVSIIYVGADTDVELKEKQDRVDDAIHAVKAARKEGILPGGGSSLAYAATIDWKLDLNGGELAGIEILEEALSAPFTKILINAGLNPKDYSLKKWGEGVDVTCGDRKNMIKQGIIDPLLVTKSALNNAISVATTILSTDCVISNVREE